MGVKVDYTELQNTASQLSSGREEMISQLNRLKGLVDSLVASGFVTDQASGKFQQSYQQWNTGANNVVQGLDGMSSFLNQAIARHQQLDSELGSAAGAEFHPGATPWHDQPDREVATDPRGTSE